MAIKTDKSWVQRMYDCLPCM